MKSYARKGGYLCVGRGKEPVKKDEGNRTIIG